jgi:hypothetical protein
VLPHQTTTREALMGAVERSSEGWRFERLVRLALVLHIGVLTSSQQQPQPRKVSVLFTYSSAVLAQTGWLREAVGGSYAAAPAWATCFLVRR